MYKKFAMTSKTYRWIIIGSVIALIIVGLIEYFMGRSFLGPDNKFGWWEGSKFSSNMSQKVCDPYSLLSVLHGFIIYFLLWVIDRKMSIVTRFVIAICLESGWEILQNTQYIIDLYNTRSFSFFLLGDSIINSIADIVMMILGFWIAYLIRPPITVGLFFLIEIILLFWIHDNLTLNILMLVSSSDTIKNWQLDPNASLKELFY